MSRSESSNHIGTLCRTIDNSMARRCVIMLRTNLVSHVSAFLRPAQPGITSSSYGNLADVSKRKKLGGRRAIVRVARMILKNICIATMIGLVGSVAAASAEELNVEQIVAQKIQAIL